MSVVQVFEYGNQRNALASQGNGLAFRSVVLLLGEQF